MPRSSRSHSLTTRIVNLNPTKTKRGKETYFKHSSLAKVLFGPAHWAVSVECGLRTRGATIHELSFFSGIRYELTEFILIDFHRAKLGNLSESIYTPFGDAILNKTIDGISCTEFAGSLHRALNGFCGDVADEGGAADPMET